MTMLPQEVVPDKTNLGHDAEERLSDGLRILARVIRRQRGEASLKGQLAQVLARLALRKGGQPAMPQNEAPPGRPGPGGEEG